LHVYHYIHCIFSIPKAFAMSYMSGGFQYTLSADLIMPITHKTSKATHMRVLRSQPIRGIMLSMLAMIALTTITTRKDRFRYAQYLAYLYPGLKTRASMAPTKGITQAIMPQTASSCSLLTPILRSPTTNVFLV